MQEHNAVTDSSVARTQQIAYNMVIGDKDNVTPANRDGRYRRAMNAQTNKKHVVDSSDYTRFLKNKTAFRK
jgi:hypothetical protein